MQRNLEIDRIRALGSLIILTYHLLFVFYPNFIFPDGFHAFGITALDLFFVVSGYAISLVLLKQIDPYQSHPERLVANLKIFAIKRATRIYPALYTGFFIVFILSIIFDKSGIFSSPYNNFQSGLMLLSSTYNFFFMDRFASIALTPFWTFTIEEQFYLAFPLFLLLTNSTRQRVWILFTALALLTFVIQPLSFYAYGLNAIFFTQSHLNPIICGCLIYIMTQQSWFHELKPKIYGFSLLRMSVVTLLLYLCIAVTTLGFSPLLYLPLGCIFSSALVTIATFEKGMVSFPYGINKMLDMLAPRSVSLYICHFPTFLLIDLLFNQYAAATSMLPLQKSIAALLIVFGVGECVFQFIIKPSIQAGVRLSYSIKKNAEALTAGQPSSTTFAQTSETAMQSP